jgi:hypothetical protein
MTKLTLHSVPKQRLVSEEYVHRLFTHSFDCLFLRKPLTCSRWLLLSRGAPSATSAYERVK